MKSFSTSHPFCRHALAAAAALALGATASAAHAAAFSWTSGSFATGVTAPSPLAAGDVLNIGSGGTKLFDGAGSNFTNGGTVNWTADALYLMNGVAVVNNGLWNATSDDQLLYNGGGLPSFTNNGTLRKSVGTGATTINGNLGFVNNGTVNAQTGSINFSGGSQFNAGSVFSGAGAVNMVSGTNTFAGSFTSTNLRLASGTFAGNAAVLNGNVSLVSGAMTGTWQVAPGQTLTATDGGTKIIDGAGTVITNKGTVAWNTAEALYLQNGAAFVNQGVFVANQSTSLLYNGGGSPSFENTASGTVRAAAGQTLTINSVVGFVNNAGTLQALAGGAIVYAGGSTFNAGTVFTGAGNNVAAGSNTFNGSFTSANLVLQGGVHAGNGAVVNGSVALTGGIVTGTWAVAAGQTLRAQDGGTKIIDGAGTVITNNGTLAWDSTGALYLQNGAVFRNQGLFVANQSTSVLYNGGATPGFENTATGTVRAAAGQTLAITSTTGFVNNGGVLNALSGGAIRYDSATFNTGTQFTGAGSNVASGSNRFNGRLDSANLVLESGTHTGNGAVINGNVAWTGGYVSGTWTVAPGQTLQGLGGNAKLLDGAGTVLTNQGTVGWSGGGLYLQNGASLVNQGVMDVSGDAVVLYNGGATPSFVNSGLIVKSAGSGALIGTLTIGDVLGFNNLGTVDVRSGVIQLPGNFSNNGTLAGTGSYNVSGLLTNAGTVAPGASSGGSPATLGLSGSFAQTSAGIFAVDLQSQATHDLFNITGTAALGGTLALRCFAGCSLAVGDVVTILDADGDISGSFANVTLNGFASGAFSVIYDTAADRVQLLVTQNVTAAVPEPGSVAMLLAGLAALGGLVRRRSQPAY